jgi:hypothetical protein
MVEEMSITVNLAEVLRQEIYAQLGKAETEEVNLDRSWMRLGTMLAAFKAQECWRDLDGYASFDEFIGELKNRYHRGRTQLYAYLSVAETLGPVIPAETLEKIGISKAMELKRAMVKSGKQLPEELVTAAEAPTTTIKELRGLVGEALHVTDDRTPGTWFDWGGSFLTPEEKQLFKDAVCVTIRLLDIKKEVPDHIQRKAIFLAWAQEFLGTHSAEVYGPDSNLQDVSHQQAAILLPVSGGREDEASS